MTHRQRSRRASRGFAIVLVLWIMVLLSAIGLHLTGVARTELRIATNIAAAARAEALADGGVAEAVFALGDTDPLRRWRADGDFHRIARGSDRLTVTVTDEGGKVNPNSAPEPLMAALLRQVGSDDDTAKAIAAAITARVRPASAATPPTRFEAVEDLIDVPGVAPAIFAALRHHVTVDSAVVPKDSDDPVVARALTDYRAVTGTAAPLQTESAAPTATSPSTIVSIVSVARTGVATFARDAVVSLDGKAPKGYVVLRWARRDADDER